jgi:hypothetical protein
MVGFSKSSEAYKGKKGMSGSLIRELILYHHA